ncbi:uroporphyrinogen decarboxylase family protein [Aquisphaera insulae]|uniref:uroporphyrinogen decarboxylase family protein n=1 Tax=Aquisphaera insulae TaxID=2712864 RepID=UPI0013ED84C5|nr:uroporphyrinogen decarboxylase family protein [Aquisphaera insulae]
MSESDSTTTVGDVEALYQRRLRRYVTAMRNGRPDMVPIRPFAAEFTGVHAGFTCQELAHDYHRAFAAARRCAADYDWDATVSNMVYVWTGLTQAIGLRYYGIPGIDVAADMGFQYREPPHDNAFMKPDEYDRLIDDPTAFLMEVWLPRVSTEVVKAGEPSTIASNLSFLKGGMAMMEYFNAFGEQNARLRSESGTVSAIAGIFKAPMDILADKLRGYLGLVDDLAERPEKVLAACEALAPHLMHVAKCTADPARLVPVGFWMHRGGVPFVSPRVFKNVYWATLKPIIEELWADGIQTLFYAEGKWDKHLESFAELPERSIVYHVDQGDVARTHEVLGSKFCLSGGISNVMLAHGTPEEVRRRCKEVIEIAARDGGYIMDSSAIMQNDSRVENVRAMTDAAREFGVYSGAADACDLAPPTRAATGPRPPLSGDGRSRTAPGFVVPWAQKRETLPRDIGDADLVRAVWEHIDSLANMYIWQLLLSF